MMRFSRLFKSGSGLLILVLFVIGSASAQRTSPRRLSYNSPEDARVHLQPFLLQPLIPLNAMRVQVYAKLGKGSKEGIFGWERFSTKDGTLRACIVPTADGVERATIVSLQPKKKLSWRDVLKSRDALGTATLLQRNEDGNKTLQIRITNPESTYATHITLIVGEEWIEQITWTLVG
ncbi:MAG: hypothetical protein HY774_20165 [Acidobacteria bacterium]|nr:hypothetical protein [Acidobacteriota bacterium]